MNTATLLLISIVWSSVTIITGFFFWKVLTAKKSVEPDSFSENDNED